MQHMDHVDYPTTPYTTVEQQRIMHDLEQSKKEAFEEGDSLRSHYLNEITTEENV